MLYCIISAHVFVHVSVRTQIGFDTEAELLFSAAEH